MTDREKIAQIVAEYLCPQGKVHKMLYGAERMCYSRDNFAECEKVSECADALIENGYGNVAVELEVAQRDIENLTRTLEEANDEIKALEAENAELNASLSKMETVEKELRERLEKAVELPFIIHVSKKYAVIVYISENGKINKTHTYPTAEAEARLAELRGK